ncbi:MAG: zinc-dependent alcohol dehydrogenase family protein [Bacteroidota bacterium]
MMMKTVEFDEIGGPEVLQLREQEIPSPGENELVVRIKACGLNQAELLFFQGQYLFQPQFPSKVGLEASGIVESIGSGVSEFRLGDEVCLTPNIMPYEYGYVGEYALVPREAVIAKPQSISFEEAASFWMTYATSYAGLVMRGGLKRGEKKTVLITAASSGVGIAAIQLAKYYGATVIATTRTTEKRAFLLAQGADFVIVTETESLSEEVHKITRQKGFDIAFDPVAGAMLGDIAEAAAIEANIVLYGALSYDLGAPLPLFPMLVKGLKISGVHLVFHMLQHEDRFAEAQKVLLEGLEEGVFTPVLDRKFTLDQIQDAYRYMQSNQQKGKILIVN